MPKHNGKRSSKDESENSKVRVVRPNTLYLVTHSYTCVHYGTDEMATDQLGAYYEKRNAVLAAVEFIEKEFKVKFHDKDTWESDEYNVDEQDVGEDDEENHSVRELYETGEFETEVETEEVDKHEVRIEPVTVKDA